MVVSETERTLAEVFQLNVAGIDPKVLKQKIRLKTISNFVTLRKKKIPFFIFTETHLKDYILDAEVSIPEYSILRADRPLRKQGGVAIYYHHTFSISDTDTFSNKYCECAMAYNKDNNMVIIAAYKPPDATSAQLKECLDKINAFKAKHEDASIIMMGDMNLKFINWSTETIEKPAGITQSISAEERRASNIMLDFVNENLLVQVVKENTRKEKSLLDIILTDDDGFIFDVTVEKTTLSDHDQVTCQLLLKAANGNPRSDVPLEKKAIDNLNFMKAEWTNIKSELSALKWSEILHAEMTVDEMSESFEKQLTDICIKHTPLRAGNTKETHIPRNRLVLIRKRKKTQAKINYLKYVKKQSSPNKLKKQEKKKEDIELAIKELIKEELLQKEIEAIKKMKRNPKYFYAYMKKFNKTESFIGPLQDKQENLQSDPETKANLLQDQYVKVFSNPKNATSNKVYEKKSDAEISDITITATDILLAIKEIPLFAAPGPDKIPAIVLKECAEEIVEAIIILWRKSLHRTSS